MVKERHLRKTEWRLPSVANKPQHKKNNRKFAPHQNKSVHASTDISNRFSVFEAFESSDLINFSGEEGRHSGMCVCVCLSS